MSINRHIKKLFALVLVAAAVVVATQISVHSVAAGAGGRPANAASHAGNPNAVPPVLPPAGSSDQAREGGAFSLNPPAHGRYSNAEMNAYSTVGR